MKIFVYMCLRIILKLYEIMYIKCICLFRFLENDGNDYLIHKSTNSLLLVFDSERKVIHYYVSACLYPFIHFVDSGTSFWSVSSCCKFYRTRLMPLELALPCWVAKSTLGD